MIEAFSELVGRDDRTIGVVKFSTRKRWCLIIREAKQIRHLAWFDSEENARAFCEVLTLAITDDRHKS